MPEGSSVQTDEIEIMMLHVALELTKLTHHRVTKVDSTTPEEIRKEFIENYAAVVQAQGGKKPAQSRRSRSDKEDA